MRLIPATTALTLILALGACSDDGDAVQAEAEAVSETEAVAEAPAAEPAPEAAPEAEDETDMATLEPPAAETPQSPAEPAEPELTPEEQAEYDAAVAAAAEADPTLAILGDPDAPVRIVEYASTTCPHCADFHANLFPHIEENWIDTGRASLEMRALPTAPVQLSVAGFLLARCAGDGEDFFDALGDVFATQAELAEAAQTGELVAYYDGVAARHDVSPEELEACMADMDGINQINASVQAAQAAGVSATPGFVINGTLAQGLVDTASWDAALEAALAEQD